MKGIRDRITKFRSFLRDMIFPERCLGCGEIGSFLCEKCKMDIQPAELVCPVCRKPSLTGERHWDCEGKFRLDGMASVWKYEGVVKEVIHFIKFSGGRRLLDDFSRMAGEVICDDSYRLGVFARFLLDKVTVISFVPMRRNKRRRRGYNQAEILARKVSFLAGKEPVSLLRKSRPTESQAKLQKKDRIRNLENSFEFVGGFAPEGVVLVDDVTTTGATLNECAKVLKKAGVKEVWGFTLAKP